MNERSFMLLPKSASRTISDKSVKEVRPAPSFRRFDLR